MVNASCFHAHKFINPGIDLGFKVNDLGDGFFKGYSWGLKSEPCPVSVGFR